MTIGHLETTLRAKREGGRKLLVPYITGGLSDDWCEILRAIGDSGADAVEVGIPFSDPVMDGPTIQAASARALERGTTPATIFRDLDGVDAGVPLVAMTYYNLVHRSGERRFAGELATAGISGAIIPDLPLEESEPWEAAAAEAGVEAVLLVAPVTPDERLPRICERSRGFIYAVSRMGITGERSDVSSSAGVLGKRVREVTDRPVLVGFGISTPEQAIEASAHADGVIVASALMRILLDGGGPEDAAAFVAGLRAALDG
jgi:tryptophan synthase alpha chain